MVDDGNGVRFRLDQWDNDSEWQRIVLDQFQQFGNVIIRGRDIELVQQLHRRCQFVAELDTVGLHERQFLMVGSKLGYHQLERNRYRQRFGQFFLVLFVVGQRQ